MRMILEGLSGALVVGVLAILAFLLSQYIGLSTVLVAILIGFVIGNSFQLPSRWEIGICWVESHGLAVAVALLGVQLNLSVLMNLNPISSSLIAAAISLTFMLTFLGAKLWRVSNMEACLLASGQAICGSAAVMAASKTLQAPKAQVGLIIAVVNFLGFVGVFVTPWVAQKLLPNEVDSGFLIGNTLQSMGHVVAAGFSINDAVGHNAVLIKMCRILFLIPTLLLLIYWATQASKKQTIDPFKPTTNKQLQWFKLIPWFIWAFLGFIVLNNSGWVPQAVEVQLTQLSDGLFILAMVAIGLSIRVRDIWQHGGQLLLLGGLVFILQIGFSLLVVKLI